MSLSLSSSLYVSLSLVLSVCLSLPRPLCKSLTRSCLIALYQTHPRRNAWSRRTVRWLVSSHTPVVSPRPAEDRETQRDTEIKRERGRENSKSFNMDLQDQKGVHRNKIYSGLQETQQGMTTDYQNRHTVNTYTIHQYK